MLRVNDFPATLLTVYLAFRWGHKIRGRPTSTFEPYQPLRLSLYKSAAKGLDTGGAAKRLNRERINFISVRIHSSLLCA